MARLLFRAKYITALLDSYLLNAEQISALAGTAESQYWAFTRLGTSALLGSITFFFGSTILSIKVMSWLYTFLLTCGVIFSVILSKKIIVIFEKNLSSKNILLGGLISGALYITSDIFRYLSGNLISEAPAIFFASACLLSFVNAHTKQNIFYAILSGLLAFCLYFIKMDAIWIYVTFIISFYFFLRLQKSDEKVKWQAFLISTFIAAGCYISYAIYFYPLANPINLIRFADSLKNGNLNLGGYPALPQLFVAAGLLLIGWIISTFYNIKKPLFWFTFTWFFLIILPYIDTLINDYIIQVRILALIMLPLMIASTYGWATLLESNKIPPKQKQTTLYLLVFISITLIAISQAESYRMLRKLPGGWRLQYVQQYLSTPNFQRKYFPLKELDIVSKLLYQNTSRNLIFWNKDNNPEYDEYIAILRYLAPGKMQVTNFFQDFSPNEGSCQANINYSGIEPVSFCTDASYNNEDTNLTPKVGLWVMSPTPCTSPNSALFQSEHVNLCSWPIQQ